MTISNTIRTAGPFIGNGITTAFPFTFKVFKKEEVLAVQTDVATGVATPLVLNSGYSVVLNVDQNANPGGTATTASPLATGQTLVLTSDLAYLQPIDITNGGGFYPAVLNSALDRLTIFCQQLFSLARRSLKLPLSDTGMNTELPSAAVRANKLLGFDANGLPIVAAPVSGSAAEVAIALANAISAYLSSIGSSLIGYIQAGLGAFSWSVQDKLRESVSVTDYMSPEQRAAAKDPTSTLDHTDAFVKAYNASNTVIVPAGYYNVNGFKINKNNFALIGVGYNQSILRATAAGALCIEAANTANVSGLKLKDFKIEGSAVAVGGIKLGSDDFYCAIPMLENVNIWYFSRIVPMAGFGLQLYKVQNVTIHNCWIFQNRYGIHHPNAGYATATKISGKSGYLGGNFVAVYIDGFYDDLYIDDVVIESNTGNGIAVTANAVRPDRGSNIFINGAYFEANGADGGFCIAVQGGPGTYQAHVLVVERIYFAANPSPFINLDRVTATIRNCKLTPAQVSTTANCTVRFDSNKYPTGSNYLAEYRALLGNIMVTDMVDANLATDLNQLNFMTGITFPAVPRTVTDRYTLDCYDEAVTGQWTPSPSGFTGTISSISGQYVKIGRIVHFEISVSGNPLSTVWTTTSISLPFPTVISAACSVFNAGNGTSPGGAYIDSTVDVVLLPTIAASNAVLLINGTYIAEE